MKIWYPGKAYYFFLENELPDFEKFIEWHDRFGGKKKFWNQYDVKKARLSKCLKMMKMKRSASCSATQT